MKTLPTWLPLPVCLLALSISPAVAQTEVTSWIGPAGGDWFDPTNWDNGLPSATVSPIIADGEVSFDSEVVALQPHIGSVTEDTSISLLDASVQGTDDFTALGLLTVGSTGNAELDIEAIGRLEITGGDLITEGPSSLFSTSIGLATLTEGGGRRIASGTALVTDGSVLSLSGGLLVGAATDGGQSGGVVDGTGELVVLGGGIQAVGTFSVGLAISSGIAEEVIGSGAAVVRGGDVVISDGVGRLFIGQAENTQGFSSVVPLANGSLFVEDGDIQAGQVVVGGAFTQFSNSPVFTSSAQAEGRLAIRRGDIFAAGVAVGTLFNSDRGSATGVIELEDASLFASSLNIQEGSTLALAVGSTTLADETPLLVSAASASAETPLGRVDVDSATINGVVEINFADGFERPC